MGDVLSRLNGGEFLGLCGIILGLFALIGGITVAITKVVAVYYRKSQLDEMEATLKMEMIQRGMNAADIKSVLEAKMGGARGNSLGDLLLGLQRGAKSASGFGKEAKENS